MKIDRTKSHPRAVTLLEVSMVMALILGLAFLGSYSMQEYQGWQKGRNASLALQAVYEAQRAYLADHPTQHAAQLQESDLLAYLPQGWGEESGVRSLAQLLSHGKVSGMSGEALSLNINLLPPTLTLGGVVYDPTQTRAGGGWDGLWDTGELPPISTAP
jgi:type II secretory pathway pseudopilin PulG